MSNGTGEAERRARYYEGLQIDAEVEARGIAAMARRENALPAMCNRAAARRAGEAGLFGRRSEELRRAS